MKYKTPQCVSVHILQKKKKKRPQELNYVALPSFRMFP